MTAVHAAAALPAPRTGCAGPVRDGRALALRERAALRLAQRQGGVAITLRRAGRAVRDGYDKLDLLAGLAERGLLRWEGLRTRGDEVEAVYAL